MLTVSKLIEEVDKKPNLPVFSTLDALKILDVAWENLTTQT